MKLLWVVVHWEIIQPFKNHLYNISNKLLSIFKCSDTLQEHSRVLRQTIKLNKLNLERMLQKFYTLFSKNHWLERRKNKEHYGDLMLLYI